MIQSPRDLSEADSLGVLAADALDDVRRDRGAAAQSRDSGARFARLLGALGEVALELGDRDQAPAPLSLDGCDRRHDAPVEGGEADAERLRRLLAGVDDRL